MSARFLRLRGLSKAFGPQVVLDGIDLDIPLGTHTTVIGKSGIGKSVLLKCIANLLEPDSGSIQMGENGEGLPQCSYMFQQNALFDSLTVFENIAMPLREKGKRSANEIESAVSGMLDKIDLADARDKYPAEISGGMQKRVALGRALITQPEIILFDEPTTGLDPQRKFAVLEMIQTYRKRFGFTALMVSHDVPEVFEISDQVAWLTDGKINFWGSPKELLSHTPEELVEFIHPKIAQL